MNIEALLKKAEAGYAPYQFMAGRRYYKGIGIKKSFEEAATWYRKAAEQGHREAQNNLDAMYLNFFEYAINFLDNLQ